jgi:hypothetical protein
MCKVRGEGACKGMEMRKCRAVALELGVLSRQRTVQ